MRSVAEAKTSETGRRGAALIVKQERQDAKPRTLGGTKKN